jgi:hypothetical protein
MTTEIGLLDVDGHNWPNLPLMKISAWHKARCHNVEPWFGPLKTYDKVYKSKVFTFTPDITPVPAAEVIEGGTGYGLDNALPPEIENIYPDYSLYGIKNTAYGFLTRGCRNRCPYCIVSKKEGIKIRRVANLDNFWRGQPFIKLLDANILQLQSSHLIRELIDTKAEIDFTQGLDIELMDCYVTREIKKLKVKRLRFAWDDPKDPLKPYEFENTKRWLGYDYSRLVVYVLTNFNTTHQEDLFRVETLKKLGFNPYIMIYDKDKAPHITRQLQRYVNNRRIFRACEWKDFYKGEQ